MNRYYFEIPNSNVFGVFKAKSRLDAQHQLMNSRYAPFYGQIRWLTSDNDYKTATDNEISSHSKVAILYPHCLPQSRA